MCEPRAAIEAISLIAVAALAAVLMVISVLATWNNTAYDGCFSALFFSLMWWLILCLLLAPIGGVLEAYIIRFHGQKTQARVIDHYRSNDAKAIHKYRIGYAYDVSVDRTTCTIVKEYVAITKDTFDRYPTGSSIPVRYLSYNPFISQPTGNERVAIELLLYIYGTMAFVAIVHTCIEYVKKTFAKSKT